MWFGVAPHARSARLATIAAALLAPGALGVLGAALPVQAVGSAPRPAVDRSCAEPFEGLRSPEVTYLVVSPLADTVRDPAASGTSGYGQVAEAVRAGGASADLLRPELDADSRVVLVPWGFDDQCRPIVWTGSWRWATTGSVGFYRGRLRPAERWIDGRPTFDVEHAVWEGFPESPWEHPLGAGRPRLSADELFDLYERLPTLEALAARPYGAVSELVEWRRDAGDALDRYPVRTLLEAAFRTADLVRLRTTALPFSGTYRIRVEGPEGDSLAGFLLRTGAVGSEALDPGNAPGEGVPAAPVPANTFAVAAALASTPDELAAATPRGETDDSTTADCYRPMGLRAAAEETVPEDATRAWSAELALPFITACFPNSSILRGLGPLDASAGGSIGSADGGAVAPDAPHQGEAGSMASEGFSGTFRQEPDGRFTFRQSASLPDGRVVRLLGSRVGLVSLPEPPALPPRLR